MFQRESAETQDAIGSRDAGVWGKMRGVINLKDVRGPHRAA